MQITTKKPIDQRINPDDWEAYRTAALWLRDNDPDDVIDQLPGNPEAVIKEFVTAYINYTDVEKCHGHYDPLGWALKAAFAFGVQMARRDITNEEEQMIEQYRKADQRDKAVVKNVLGRYEFKAGEIIDFPKAQA